MNHQHIKTVFITTFVLSMCGSANLAVAAAKLIFSPQRIIMEGNSRTASLRLRNGGDRVGTFRVSFSDAIYQSDGSVKHVKTPPPGFPTARPFLRLSPRQVRLAPGESQIIRVLAKRPQGQNKEYRVHVLMEQLPEDLNKGTNNNNSKVTKGSMRLMQASAVPVIFRVGETQATGSIASARKTAKGIDLVLARKGNRSLHTTLEAYRGNRAIPANRIGVAKGVSVPVPNLQRRISLGVKQASNQPYLVLMKDFYTNEIISQSVIK